MLCQRCNQRPATVFFSQTIGNQTTQAHLCEPCAQEQTQAYGGMNPIAFNPFTALSDLLHNFMDWGNGGIEEVQSGRVGSVAVDPQVQCPYCGYQLSTFRTNGRLGCTKCYESFKSALQPLISGIHGNVQHVEEGPRAEAVPPDPKADPDIQGMRERMKALIEAEKFEDAARLRDEIHYYENRRKQG
ncbi:MAG TPA: UvrB/UvrC motif-containing protein [bacterium]|nr:UvrB/UvrC motif-containing protein [bacterium]